jgi:hypothetical protein
MALAIILGTGYLATMHIGSFSRNACVDRLVSDSVSNAEEALFFIVNQGHDEKNGHAVVRNVSLEMCLSRPLP